MSRSVSQGTRIIDLTHTISGRMPYYPGTEPPEVSKPCTLESHGFVEQKITLYSHTGTHMDAPAHILKNAQTLEDLGVSHFVGKAMVLDLSSLGRSIIGIEDVKPFADTIEGHDFVLMYTGWSKFWGENAYYGGFPVLTEEAARFLAGFNLKGIGMDMISIDSPDTATYPVHRIFMEKNTLIIENLANLDKVLGTSFTLCCLPMKLEAADGAPVRAIALLDV